MPKQRPPHPKSRGRHISDGDHAIWLRQFGYLNDRYVVPILADLGLYARGRYHESVKRPCLYVFRDKELYESELRGTFLHIQKTHDQRGIEIVFRKVQKFCPLSAASWSRLGPDHLQPSETGWGAFCVLDVKQIGDARALVTEAVENYDEYYG